MKHFLSIGFLIFFAQLIAQTSTSLVPVNYCDFEMGDSLVSIVKENETNSKKIVFINVHENEKTSIEAFYQFNADKKYPFFYLKHNATRRIHFNHKNVVYSIDPNRIFSHYGIETTIAYDSLQNRRAEKMAKALSHEILKSIEGFEWVISLHNNTPDNYSVLTYLPGGDEAGNALLVHVNPKMDSDDFIFTTDSTLFYKLKDENINVVLQDNENCFDDGSLSVYCGKKQIRYANVEAEEGHLREQVFLIEIVEKNIK